MIDLYYWTTPNGHKISIFLEEAGIEYNLHPINIGKGDQFAPEFLKIAPNNRIPAIVDHQPIIDGKLSDEPLSLFESGAILWYLAEKTGFGLSSDPRTRLNTMQWLMWQMGGFGPMLGQNHHFSQYAPEKIDYAIDRYVTETARLYKVLNTQLASNDFVVGNELSIADIAIYPWTVNFKGQGQDLEKDFPNVKRWVDHMAQRKAVIKSYEIARTVYRNAKKEQDS